MGTPAVVTLWYVNTPTPAAVLAEEPKADRGFGRKFLAQFNPAWPISMIGQFPLNRSSAASRGEWYVGGYQGLTVVQTWIEDLGNLSEIDPSLLNARPATDVYIIAEGDGNDFGGFCHVHDGQVKRALSAVRDTLFEDIGLPEPFEAPYWAGEKSEPRGGISLPFEPRDLAREAQRVYLGAEEGLDINVVGYAVDGRPEAAPVRREDNTSKVEIARADEDEELYDDYEVHPTAREGDEFVRLAEAAAAAARRVGREAASLARRARGWQAQLNERLRHTDRPR
ncbi:DUF6928 family protein [Corynebacterium tapiri]|uniref:Uncharacterized protein n=1 Tax=Corynebacterium tapiri TaxID=1448266 RepID=A0A5C4U7P4_9CORY|nr:hypothetical protein [Corynebacterium tapiri]TNM00391.1 hypothetical protein FHE74_00090 [Corynebacterium tapiri]